MKPARTWTIAVGGLLLLIGAMAWATHSLMAMERTQHRMAGEAVVQERTRLALWRMESIAAPLVVEESARPPDQYRSAPATAPPVSPASRIQLHFELDADGRVRSPQAVDGPDKPAVPDESGRRLQELRARLAETAAPNQWALLGQIMPWRALRDNRAWLIAANRVSQQKEEVNLAEALEAPLALALALKDQTAPAPAAAAGYAPPQLPSAMKPAEAREEQDFNNRKEAGMRQRAVGDLARSAAVQRQQIEVLPKYKKADPVPAAKSMEETEDQTDSLPTSPAEDKNTPATASIAHAMDAAPANALDGQSITTPPANVAPAIPQADPSPPASISDFRALWIKDALLLTRRVSQDGASIVQGAWVDWPQLRTDLLNAVSDLFPAAMLEAAPSVTGGGSDLLASLPIRLVPGRLDIPAAAFWSPLKLSLATAWGCVILASGAVALVLRGMMLLSGRRAAFVSAVTHELRTPLATFKLYSEMLADGLVTDPAKRQSYLETLTTEADRLGHLVENVLAYSRLERGKGSDGQIRISLGGLLQRVEPRLHQRVSTAGAQFSIRHAGVPADFEIMTDPSAVEQILFNLVDNACKYARQDDAPARMDLVIKRALAALEFSLRDHGPGLTKAEAGKLFRPFHKSAREAAHSAPGVGLGLALCRRLARDLGGTLEIDHAWTHGACFVLTLPVVRAGL